jgi:hypothetical protein
MAAKVVRRRPSRGAATPEAAPGAERAAGERERSTREARVKPAAKVVAKAKPAARKAAKGRRRPG